MEGKAYAIRKSGMKIILNQIEAVEDLIVLQRKMKRNLVCTCKLSFRVNDQPCRLPHCGHSTSNAYPNQMPLQRLHQ
jgi:hypothetical protein